MTLHTLIATAAFGLEAIVKRELQQLGYEPTSVEDGRVRFSGDAAAIARTNLWLRSADRVLLEVGEFEAHDFGELFDRTHTLPWEQWLSVDAAFPVTGRSVKSQLHSVPDCQRIVKKAIVERLKAVHHRDWFDETGPSYPVDVSLLRDRATLTIDTSGAGLHKRGYRTLVGRAPLKETLAAALVQLSFWNASRPFADPCCGSGTIPIEAALLGRHIAPGINRSFIAEQWPQVEHRVWNDARTEARDVIRAKPEFRLIGTDIDASELTLARQHAAAAGVADDVHFQQRPLAEFSTPHKYGCLITNPPYGERLGEAAEVEVLYRELGRWFRELETWSAYVLTSHPNFERLFGKSAERRRKLYNARIACTYYQYQGPRPPRPRA
ncbi:MAG: class I SAM-dependent RNA methyltransferase [Planctomycetaceae bacterium]|nr:class I SAM-dependent RNA methyltransferase [Planctomycetaceae bacterium]